MSHNTRTRADLAHWGSGVVTAAEFNKLDLQAFQSINGDLGGTWAPVTAIEVGGAGLLVSGPFSSTGTADLYGATNLHGTVDFLADVEFHDAVNFDLTADFFDDVEFHNAVNFDDGVDFFDDVVFHAEAAFESPVAVNDILDVYGLATFHGDVELGQGSSDHAYVRGALDVYAAAVFHSDVELGQDLADQVDVLGLFDVYAASNFHEGVDFLADAVFHQAVQLGTTAGDDIDILGTATLRTPMGFAGNGRVPLRPVTGENANRAYAFSDCNAIYVESLSTDRTYSISAIGCVNGDEMWVVNHSSHDLAVNSGISTTYLRHPTDGNLDRPWVHLVFLDTSWVVFNRFAPY